MLTAFLIRKSIRYVNVYCPAENIITLPFLLPTCNSSKGAVEFQAGFSNSFSFPTLLLFCSFPFVIHHSDSCFSGVNSWHKYLTRNFFKNPLTHHVSVDFFNLGDQSYHRIQILEHFQNYREDTFHQQLKSLNGKILQGFYPNSFPFTSQFFWFCFNVLKHILQYIDLIL